MLYRLSYALSGSRAVRGNHRANQGWPANGYSVERGITADGLYGQAFISTNAADPNIIIAFEGTNLGHKPSSLINGTSLEQIEVDAVTYWHVELESHDILLAENLPAESYLDMGNRGFFVEAKVLALHGVPDAPQRSHDDFCRPFVASGPLVDAVDAQLRQPALRVKRVA